MVFTTETHVFHDITLEDVLWWMMSLRWLMLLHMVFSFSVMVWSVPLMLDHILLLHFLPPFFIVVNTHPFYLQQIEKGQECLSLVLHLYDIFLRIWVFQFNTLASIQSEPWYFLR